MFPNAALIEEDFHTDPVQPTIKNVLQITIYNNGSKPFTLGYREYKKGESYIVDPCGAKFEFDISKLKFSGTNPKENHAIASYHVYQAPVTNNCN